MKFADCLLILFIALKLTNVVDWSWWWVMSPIWIVFTLAFISLLANDAAQKR